MVLVCHVDDVLAVGPQALLDQFVKDIWGKLTLKVVGQLKEDVWLKYLGKEWKREGCGFVVRIPDAYLTDLYEAAGLSSAKPVKTPGTSARIQTDGDSKPLTGLEYQRFRTVLGKVMWLMQERGEVCFATKEIARDMSCPTQQSWESLKRAVRYLRLCKREQVLTTRGVVKPEVLDVFTDSNWASAGNDRKSTSCGAIMVGSFPLLFYSRTQSVIALSSGEAELLALTSGLQEAKGVHTLLTELGLPLRIVAHTDSSAAIGIATRRGLGKLKHIELRQLWIQQETEARRVMIKKVSGLENVADLGTKHLSPAQLEKCCVMLGLRVTEGTQSHPEPSINLLECHMPNSHRFVYFYHSEWERDSNDSQSFARFRVTRTEKVHQTALLDGSVDNGY